MCRVRLSSCPSVSRVMGLVFHLPAPLGVTESEGWDKWLGNVSCCTVHLTLCVHTTPSASSHQNLLVPFCKELCYWDIGVI